MDEKRVDTAVIEAKRFLARVAEWKLAVEYAERNRSPNGFIANTPRQNGAVKRASMDLSRALVDLRKSGFA